MMCNLDYVTCDSVYVTAFRFITFVWKRLW